jgi:hypothetical protein
VKFTLDQAIQMAVQHNQALLAARTTVQQSLAQEVTANLRPNPEVSAVWAYLPLFNPEEGLFSYLPARRQGRRESRFVLYRLEKMSPAQCHELGQRRGNLRRRFRHVAWSQARAVPDQNADGWQDGRLHSDQTANVTRAANEKTGGTETTEERWQGSQSVIA